jgi:hypothetical protein
MNIIVTLDNNNGMLFNNRRQTRDAIVNQRILELTNNQPLLINNFSWQMLNFAKDKIIVTEKFLDIATDEDFCFVENKRLKHYEGKINSIYVFKWNREYPNDFTLDIDLNDWKCTYFEEFSGSSHESIYLEIYKRKRGK